jgi:hypothetical protein
MSTVYDLYVNRDYVRSFHSRQRVKRAFNAAVNDGAIDVAWVVADTSGPAYARDWPRFDGCTTVERKFS